MSDNTADLREMIVLFRPDSQGEEIATEPIVIVPDGQWTRNAGVKSDVFSATVPCKEFDKISKNLNLTGSIEFWLTSDPNADGGGGAEGGADFTMDMMRILDVEKKSVGILAGESVPRIIDYTLHFADRREQFAPPRGGRLFAGQINGGDPATDYNVDDEQDLAKFSELIGMCLAAMKLPDTAANIPASVDDVDPPRNLKWLGNSAPQELEKLLKQCGAEMIVHLDGTVRIVVIGDDDEPELDNMLWDVPLPGIDRRGKTAVVSSCPLAIVDTCTVPCAGYGISWKWVYRDGGGDWHDVSDGKYGAADVANNFANVPAADKESVKATLYVCLQITFAGGDGMPTPDSVVLANVYDTPDSGSQPLIYPPYAEAIRCLAEGGTKNEDLTFHFVHLERTLFKANAGGRQVLWLPRRIVKLKAGGTDPAKDIAEITTDDMQLGVSFNFYRQGQGATLPTPEYYNAGFQQQPGGVTQLDSDALGQLLGLGDPSSDKSGEDSQDLIIVSRPQLRAFRATDPLTNDPLKPGSDPFNKKDLDEKAKKIAQPLLQNSGQVMRTSACAGIAPVELSGLVAEATWDFEAYRTDVSINNWWAPRKDVLSIERVKGSGFPSQDQMQASINSDNAIGGVERFSPVGGGMGGSSAAAASTSLGTPTGLWQVLSVTSFTGGSPPKFTTDFTELHFTA